ncbi:MAG TPA: hypothetical protein VJ987_13520 [Anaerolineales bacterium]|nr:hypothetical protein [Anaerolineales bacterium]
MNLRCSFCQTPFTIGRVEKLDALQHMDANNLSHYDAHCPRCRRATPIPRKRLEMTMPNWRDALKELEAEMKANPQQEAPLPKPEAVADARQGNAAPKAESKPEPEPAKVVKEEKKPAAKKTTAKKTTTKKSK